MISKIARQRIPQLFLKSSGIVFGKVRTGGLQVKRLYTVFMYKKHQTYSLLQQLTTAILSQDNVLLLQLNLPFSKD